jgi:ATPase subunit of ABC transporter with duplicated ATPase domains
MDSRIAILGANGTGKSTLLHLITGALQPVQGTISKHSAIKLAKYSQHSADQLPYEKSPIEYFQSLFAEKYPEKDIMVFYFSFFRFIKPVLTSIFFLSSPGVARSARSVRSVGGASDSAYQAALGWLA